MKQVKLTCSFCGKSQDDCERLISNPEGSKHKAYICDDCVAVCANILNDDRGTQIPVADRIPLRVRLAKRLAGTYGRIHELPKHPN